VSASEMSVSQWGAIQIYLPFTFTATDDDDDDDDDDVAD